MSPTCGRVAKIAIKGNGAATLNIKRLGFDYSAIFGILLQKGRCLNLPIYNVCKYAYYINNNIWHLHSLSIDESHCCCATKCRVKHPPFSNSSVTLPLLRSELNILTTNCNETLLRHKFYNQQLVRKRTSRRRLIYNTYRHLPLTVRHFYCIDNAVTTYDYKVY